MADKFAVSSAFGKALKTYRKPRASYRGNYMLIDIERGTGLSVSALSRIENGKKTVTLETAHAICSYLGPDFLDYLRTYIFEEHKTFNDYIGSIMPEYNPEIAKHVLTTFYKTRRLNPDDVDAVLNFISSMAYKNRKK